MIFAIFGLLVVYQLKHFLADYPLQRPWMLGKFKDKGWALPLAAHALVHAYFTLSISILFLKWGGHANGWLIATGLAAFDFAVHFTMDRVKASPKLLGRFKGLSADEYRVCVNTVKNLPEVTWAPQDEVLQRVAVAQKRMRDNRMFWHCLGIDQMVHHLTHYAIIAILVTR